jgi:thioredoxin reductase
VSAVGRQSIGGGGDSGEEEIWEMAKFLKINLNVDHPRFQAFLVKKKKQKNKKPHWKTDGRETDKSLMRRSTLLE